MGEVIICEPRRDCADPHTLRWHCMRGHGGADPGVCPLTLCERRGANRSAPTPSLGDETTPGGGRGGEGGCDG